MQAYHREAREPFTDTSKERVLAPDATVTLTDPQGRKLSTFIEIDLGTMSHTRLRAKAELYAAYAASDAWRERHPFLPALLFLTTTDIRAAKFLKALARSLSYGPRRHGRRAFVAGGAGIAWTPQRLLAEPCLADLDGNTGLTLLQILNAARAPHDRAQAHRREQQEAEDARRQNLLDDLGAMREHLRRHESSLRSYLGGLGALGEQTASLLLSATDPPDVDERAALRSIAHDLDLALLEPGMHTLPEPGPSVISDVTLLADLYHSRQDKLVAALIDRHRDGPSLRHARQALRDGQLIERKVIDRLPAAVERDAAGRQAQARRRDAYLEWRERAARQLTRKAGGLGRLTHPSADFYPQLDSRHLKVCGRCEEVVYPPAHDEQGLYGERRSSCHYCGDSYQLRDYTEHPTSPPENERWSAQP